MRASKTESDGAWRMVKKNVEENENPGLYYVNKFSM